MAARWMMVKGLVLVALTGLMVWGCAAGGPKATCNVDDLVKQTQAQQNQGNRSTTNIRSLNAKLFSSVSNTPEMEDYVISEGDLLEITIFEAEELNTEARVGARGYVTLPLIGTVMLKGLTTREAEQKIEDLYRAKYLRDPHANLFVKEQYGGRITVLGAVEHPGTYDYYSQRRLLDVLALAGGLTDKAGRLVQLRRPSDNPEHPATFLVDLDKLIEEGQSQLNLVVHKGDVVYVPDAGVVYVDGAVRHPGSYPLKEETSVREAIVMAGGFRSIAAEDHIKLIRELSKGQREVVDLKLSSTNGKSADDIKVQDGDVVFVETNSAEALIYGLRLNVLSGLVGVGYTPPQQ